MTVDASCAGNACGGFSVEGSAQTSSDPEWCEFLLTQHVPQGAYIDVDEVKVRMLEQALVLLRASISLFCAPPAGTYFHNTATMSNYISENTAVGVVAR